MTRPASLRLRSALTLSLAITLVWAAAAAITWHLLRREMNEVFDSALQETGQRILQLAVIDVLGRDEEGVTQHVTALDEHTEYFTYLVRDPKGRVLLTSHSADPAQFPVLNGAGFHQTDAFRFYQESAVQGNITLTIAEPMAHRREVAGEVALALTLPLALVIPLSILGIAYGLGFGLRPLRQLRQQLGQRDSNDLAPLQTDALPAELRPIAETVNQLFLRLGAAFEAERSFASNAAHELRTPLAGAIAQVQRLRKETTEPKIAARADQIEAVLKRLTRLSERLMQLARAEGARLVSDTPQDLRPVLQLVAGDFARGADAGRAVLTLPPAPVLSTLDPDAAAIITRNLIENALRHGNAGTVRVALTADGWLTVENDGPVVPPDLLASLSGRFVRGATTGSGVGLGLAIVRTIADRSGLNLRLASPIPSQADGFSASIFLCPAKTNPVS
jgi:two-component system OmpR family sensor kinase